jgi:NADPH:quinone reductase-like Zn-dependent oxidoreductase
VDHPVVDHGSIAATVRDIAPSGVDAALELVGGTALADTLAGVRVHGVTCFTGAVGGAWTIPDFSPFLIPTGVRLTSYAGDADDLPPEVLQRQLEAIAAGRLTVPVARAYRGLEQVPGAHAALESGSTTGKHVVVLDH